MIPPLLISLTKRSPDEAISWGKIRLSARPVKVYAEATIVFPLIVAGTFYREYERRKKELEK